MISAPLDARWRRCVDERGPKEAALAVARVRRAWERYAFAYCSSNTRDLHIAASAMGRCQRIPQLLPGPVRGNHQSGNVWVRPATTIGVPLADRRPTDRNLPLKEPP